MSRVNIQLVFISVIFFNILYFHNVQTIILFYDLKTVEDLQLKYKDYFPSLNNQLPQISEENVKIQLEIGNKNEDKNLNATELIEKYGFKSEIHHVETEDGYKPSMYRIPGYGEAVLLVHGLHSSGVDWLTVGPQAALPYLLAHEGYDVWLANARGSTADASGHRRHSAKMNAKQYWDFSWDEIGRYDLSAFINYILKVSNYPKLKYVGHSQGTTAFFVLCSERPEYNDKISLMIALAPVVFMSHLVSPLARLTSPVAGPYSEVIRNVIGLQTLTPDVLLANKLTKIICGDSVLAFICTNIMFLLGGFDYAQVNVTNMPVVFAHTPGGAASKQFLHYAQEINSEKFRKYDYGSRKNLVRYRKEEPPDYPIEKVTAPVALFYKTKNKDWFSAYEDVLKLRGKLKNVVDFYEVPYEEFAHTDYIWAKDVKKFVYIRILQLFMEY